MAEVAVILRRNADTIHRWINKGAIPAVQVGRSKMIRRADIEYLILGSRTGEASVVDAGVPPLTDAQLDLIRRAILGALDSLRAPKSA